jgi:hypothetical protein
VSANLISQCGTDDCPNDGTYAVYSERGRLLGVQCEACARDFDDLLWCVELRRVAA